MVCKQMLLLIMALFLSACQTPNFSVEEENRVSPPDNYLTLSNRKSEIEPSPDSSVVSINNESDEVKKNSKNMTILFSNGNAEKLSQLCKDGNLMACKAESLLANDLDMNYSQKICETEGLNLFCEYQNVLNYKWSDFLDKCSNSLSANLEENKLTCAAINRWIDRCEKLHSYSHCKYLNDLTVGTSDQGKFAEPFCSVDDQKSCAIIEYVNLRSKSKCGDSISQIRKKIGPEDEIYHCDQIYKYLKYGQHWLIFKANGLLGIQSHEMLNTKCIDFKFQNYFKVCE